MGRLHHLKESLPVIMSQPNSEVVVIDYSCPDDSGRWVKKNYPACHVTEVEGEEYFSLTKARNASIPAIKQIDCNWLCFVDADTIIADHFTEKVVPLLEENTFITAYNIYNKVSGLGGLLIVSKENFLQIGGYDETITGYGTNASEIRLRLYFNGADFKILPDGLATHIDHGYSNTYSKYKVANNISLYNNTKRLLKKIERWEKETGKEVPRELYKKERIKGIESTLPFAQFPLIWSKVFLRRVLIKTKLLIGVE